MAPDAAVVLGGEDLGRAFASFTSATARLEREYGLLRTRVAALTAEVEEKNRLLVEGAERERRLEAEVVRQSRLAAMGEMAAMLAHEVRNPLGAMELFTGLLLQDLREQPATLQLAQHVARGITDLNHLVGNLLEFTSNRSIRARPFSCDAVIEDALRYTADLRLANRVAVEWRPSGTLEAVGDAELARPVLLNLIRNAVQAMPDGGTLTVEAEADGAEVVLAVADTGPGVPAEQAEQIFMPFFTTKTKGTGLGLTVARGLVTAMGGRLALGRAAAGGARFTLALPAAGIEGGDEG
jgi:two-component system sensor histidine kinase FlrB